MKKNSILKEKIIVNESIGKILIESLIVSLIVTIFLLIGVKLLSTESMIKLMWKLVNCPECIILPLFPVLLSIIAFIKFITVSIKEEKNEK